jgi:hypothetical protein
VTEQEKHLPAEMLKASLKEFRKRNEYVVVWVERLVNNFPNWQQLFEVDNKVSDEVRLGGFVVWCNEWMKDSGVIKFDEQKDWLPVIGVSIKQAKQQKSLFGLATGGFISGLELQTDRRDLIEAYVYEAYQVVTNG